MGGSAKSRPVRQYIRSKVPRMKWTPELHRSFMDAVDRLGGQKPTAKLVLREMGVTGLTIAHVKSHLQMYRSRELCKQYYTSHSNGGRRDTYEDFTNGYEDHYHYSFTYPKPMSERVSAQYNIDDYTQDIEEECGMKDFSWQDAAESGYFKISDPNDTDEKFQCSTSMLENDNEEDETNGCSLSLSLALNPKQASDESSMSGRICILSSSRRSFKELSGFSDGNPVDLELSMSVCAT